MKKIIALFCSTIAIATSVPTDAARYLQFDFQGQSDPFYSPYDRRGVTSDVHALITIDTLNSSLGWGESVAYSSTGFSYGYFSPPWDAISVSAQFAPIDFSTSEFSITTPADGFFSYAFMGKYNLYYGTGDVNTSGSLVVRGSDSQFSTTQLAQISHIDSVIPDGQPGAGINPVPEPATWAMMIGGFGLVGGAMRRRSNKAIASIA